MGGGGLTRRKPVAAAVSSQHLRGNVGNSRGSGVPNKKQNRAGEVQGGCGEQPAQQQKTHAVSLCSTKQGRSAVVDK